MAPPSPQPQTRQPILEGRELLLFPDSAAFEASRDLLAGGAVQALCNDPPPVGDGLWLQLRVGVTTHESVLPASCEPAGADMVLLRFLDPVELDRTVAQLSETLGLGTEAVPSAETQLEPFHAPAEPLVEAVPLEPEGLPAELELEPIPEPATEVAAAAAVVRQPDPEPAQTPVPPPELPVGSPTYTEPELELIPTAEAVVELAAEANSEAPIELEPLPDEANLPPLEPLVEATPPTEASVAAPELEPGPMLAPETVAEAVMALPPEIQLERPPTELPLPPLEPLIETAPPAEAPTPPPELELEPIPEAAPEKQAEAVLAPPAEAELETAPQELSVSSPQPPVESPAPVPELELEPIPDLVVHPLGAALAPAELQQESMPETAAASPSEPAEPLPELELVPVEEPAAEASLPPPEPFVEATPAPASPAFVPELELIPIPEPVAPAAVAIPIEPRPPLAAPPPPPPPPPTETRAASAPRPKAAGPSLGQTAPPILEGRDLLMFLDPGVFGSAVDGLLANNSIRALCIQKPPLGEKLSLQLRVAGNVYPRALAALCSPGSDGMVQIKFLDPVAIIQAVGQIMETLTGAAKAAPPPAASRAAPAPPRPETTQVARPQPRPPVRSEPPPPPPPPRPPEPPPPPPPPEPPPAPKRPTEPPRASPPAPTAEEAGIRSSGSAAVPGLGPVALALAKSGPFENPATADAFLALPVSRSPTAEECARPSAFLLLRWLTTLRGLNKVTVTTQRGEQSFFVAGGQEVRAGAPMTVIAEPLGNPRGSYRVEEIREIPKVRYTHSTRRLAVDVLRLCLQRLDVPQLEAGFAFKSSLSPKLIPEGLAVLPVVCANPGQTRVANRMLDGNYTVRQVVLNGSGVQSTWGLLYLLDLFGALTWIEAPPPPASADSAEERWKVMASQDHFEVLGLHWSSNPALIEPAFQTLIERYGPASPLAKKEPAVAAQICSRLEEARRILGNHESRRKYRRESYPMIDFASQTGIILGQVQLALLREDFTTARDMALGIYDINPTPQVTAILARLGVSKPEH